jgi:two-component system LytT family response regulator
MTTAIIVDDERDGISVLSHLLNENLPHIEVIGTAETHQTAYQMMVDKRPQLVFLDIQMPGKNGFEILKQIEEIDFEVIFVTAYSDFAIKAFKFDAIDYLLKPIDIDDLKGAVAKAEARIHDRQKSKINIDGLIYNLVNIHNPFNKICIPCKEAMIFIEISNIMYCESDINYSRIYIKAGAPIISAKPLRMYDDLLAGMNFFRIHKSYIVNLSHIQEYVRGDGGYVIMTNGAELPVSRRQREAFASRLSFP